MTENDAETGQEAFLRALRPDVVVEVPGVPNGALSIAQALQVRDWYDERHRSYRTRPPGDGWTVTTSHIFPGGSRIGERNTIVWAGGRYGTGLHRGAPVRFVEWRRSGRPLGHPDRFTSTLPDELAVTIDGLDGVLPAPGAGYRLWTWLIDPAGVGRFVFFPNVDHHVDGTVTLARNGSDDWWGPNPAKHLVCWSAWAGETRPPSELWSIHDRMSASEWVE